MGTCYSCNGLKNKVRPTTPRSAVPKTVTDNFVRGRADGESDASDSEKVTRSPPPPHPLIYPGHLERHVLGSSFSSSCSSQSIPDLDDSKDPDVGAQCGVMGDRGMVRATGQHKELDPLTHFYQLTGSSRVHHHDSRLSRYDMLSEVASEVKTEGGLTDVAIDLDHPFAPLYPDEEGILVESMLSRPRSVGLRGRSSYARDMMSQLSNYEDFESPRDPSLKREDTPIPGSRNRHGAGSLHQSVLGRRKGSKRRGNRPKRGRVGLPYEEIHRPIPSGLSESSLSVRSDDGGSSLSSSSSLSAIGELSELSSAATSRKSIKAVTTCQSNIPPKKQTVKKMPVAREKSNHSSKTPKSAETMPNPKVINLSPVQVKSADLLNRRESTGHLFTKVPQLTRSTNPTKPASVSGAWGDSFHNDMGISLVARGNMYSNHLSSQSFNKQMPGRPYGRDIRSPISPRDSLQLTSPSPREEPHERPMGARPRRPGTGQNHPTPAPRPAVSKKLASLIKEDLYPNEIMEAYPDLPGTLGEDKFQTIIII